MRTATTRHHPIFERFNRIGAWADGERRCNFLGALSRCEWEAQVTPTLLSSGATALVNDDPTLPHPLSEDYYEWIDLLTAVAEAGPRMIMVELGAGYGRWAINCAVACRRVLGREQPEARLIAVEGDQRRIGWLREHFEMNGLRLEGEVGHQIIEAVVGRHTAPAVFAEGPLTDYGFGTARLTAAALTKVLASGAERVGLRDSGYEYAGRVVTTRPLADILAIPNAPVDYLSVDIQGAEADVIEGGIDAMNRLVRRIHIGTHGHDLEDRLHDCLVASGWVITRFWRRHTDCHAEYGRFTTDDGMVAALNPRLCSLVSSEVNG
jgi:FkbM family methyltransferase